eukprot:CAMPEP_0175141688 /NCGR_PEP_ID=MMETSP0087-20121206/12290_1 /TAXON_ID=136419 /ORGANISM="Unknown Unknown, Strain D1" /LENGTH=117 /DNA_ID=CAMNT_0016425223 /DNA_START=7 /DNA_END=360 /DNA_ORIENTATION=+
MNRLLASFLGATGVTLGAFGAHALKATLTQRGTLESWKTGVLYQLLHAIALLYVDQANLQNGDLITKLWFVGTVLFSGSIYGLSLGGPRVLGPVTPLGGLCMIAGWVALGLSSGGLK